MGQILFSDISTLIWNDFTDLTEQNFAVVLIGSYLRKGLDPQDLAQSYYYSNKVHLHSAVHQGSQSASSRYPLRLRCSCCQLHFTVTAAISKVVLYIIVPVLFRYSQCRVMQVQQLHPVLNMHPTMSREAYTNTC